MSLKRKAAVFLSIVFCLGITAILLPNDNEYKTASADAFQCNTVIIDPGHGGFDGGAVAGDGTVEKNINLEISNKLSDFLTLCGFRVIMTRTSDDSTDNIDGSVAKRKRNDLENRLLLMEKNPDSIYVSIHLNKFTTSAASGTQVFYSPKFKESEILSKAIQKRVVDMLQPENTRTVKKGTSATFLLKNAKVPAVIVECGFLSNKYDLEKLKDEEYQSQMAFAIACGINDYYIKN